MAAELAVAVAWAGAVLVPLGPAEFVGGELAVAAATALLVAVVYPAVEIVVERFDIAPPAVPSAVVVVVVAAAAAVVAAELELAFALVEFFLFSYQYYELTVEGVV